MKLILFYRHVTVLDYAYLDQKLGPVGNSMQVNVSFHGKTDNEGVIYDFSHAKKKVKAIIDDVCDHRLVLPAGVVSAENYEDKNISFDYQFGLDHRLTHTAPNEAFFFLSESEYTNKALKEDLEKIILKEMPGNIERIELEFESELFEKGKAVFNYTHGLKEHDGNCQRLLHGHRNTIDLLEDGEENFELERALVACFPERNIHFAYLENVVNKEEVQDRFMGNTIQGVAPGEIFPVQIEYTSQQGKFRATIPSFMVHFVAIETTVENLSAHFHSYVKSHFNLDSHLVVRAYEGIGKGAIFNL